MNGAEGLSQTPRRKSFPRDVHVTSSCCVCVLCHGGGFVRLPCTIESAIISPWIFTGLEPQTTDFECVSKKMVEIGTGQYLKWIEGFITSKTHWNQPYIYLLPLASKTSFTVLYSKPSRAPTLICLPCCAILACSKVESWDYKFIIQMNLWITNFLLLVLSSHKSSVGAREAWQWACPTSISVVCG